MQNYCSPYAQNPNAIYRFIGTWTAAERTAIMSGIQQWDGLRDNLAAAVYSSSEDTTGSTYTVKIERSTTVNNSDCTSTAATHSSPGTIRLMTPTAVIARHEMGHFHGLSHSGRFQSIADGSTPAMYGCPAGSVVSADDRGAVANRRSARYTPNGGFENAPYNVGFTTESGSASDYTGSVYQGSHALNIAQGSVVSNSQRLVSPPSSLTARTRYKHSGSSGTFKFQYRTVSYPAGSSCGNAYNPTTISWDANPTVGAFVIDAQTSIGPASSYIPASVSSVTSLTGTVVDVKVSVLAPGNAALFVDNMEI